MSTSGILEALKALSEETRNQELNKECNQLSKALQKGLIDFTQVINCLSEYILNFDDAILFRKHLSHILLALVASKIPLKSVFSNENFSICSDTEKSNHIEYCVVLSLLSDHPDILQYALNYFEINPIPPFEVFIHHEESFNIAPKKRRLQNYRQHVSDYQIVSCCYHLLTKLPNYLSDKWNWSSFITNFSGHLDLEIRWMVKECMSIITNMPERHSRKLMEKSKITEVQEMHYSKKLRDELQIHFRKHDISDVQFNNVLNIDGILLQIFNKDDVQPGILVPVKSTINNLRSLALAVASGKALCLMGPVGSGKTSLVEHLAAVTGRKEKVFKKVQLGDQTDARMLLGTHQCTDIPGEFVWRPGVLTQAVEKGYWLLLEDIDCATLDVASTLSSLLERNTLSVPGYRDSLPVSPGFQLFVTQRTFLTNYGYQKKISNASTLLQKQLIQIDVEPLSRSELKEIIQTNYPALTTICPKMLEVFMLFSVGSHDNSLQTKETIETKESSNSVSNMRGHRLISTRDLMKWCARSIVGFEVTSPDSALKVLQDAFDIFTCSIPYPETRLQLAKTVGTCLGIVETKSEFFCLKHKPHVSLNPNVLEVGRAKILRSDKFLEPLTKEQKQQNQVFSFTRETACLLERIACCIMSKEPVLLVGETGTGKTSSVQYLAKQTGHKLVVINMNQQSDSADLLGGFKPVDMKYVIKPIKNEYEALFKTLFNVEKNKKFLNHIDTCYEAENWTSLLVLIKQSYKAGLSRITKNNNRVLISKWAPFASKLEKLEQQVKASSKLTFAFLEGSLIKAMEEGHWVLLDEINLASAEILECLAGLLEDKMNEIELYEKGDNVPIKKHPDFTLFACMNPATDVGKKDLPVGLRNRFTEFFIDELTDPNSLILLVGDYLYHMNLSATLLEAICTFYLNIKKEAQKTLVDGAGNAPHYSLRTLCRALTAASKAKCGTVTRSLFEAFCLSFLTQLDHSSHPKVEAMIAKAVTGKKTLKSVLNQVIPEPQTDDGMTYLLFEGHWIAKGKLNVTIPDEYILTPTVRKNLRDIARIISLGKLPVLIQGDTSVGKTSLITYIAKASGNYCVRINNHEHTDLQEYIGSYASDANGKLVFKEGVLVEAMRKGYWLILDELNLAPSDVLEALNRVLDDNRELFIPETQQVVKADPNFMLFATQNPPGLYGGRKMLSRAFRNRFVELHFDDIPRKELETILNQRCHIPLTYSKKMIAVMAELQIRRRGSAAVQGKDSFITLRDLFRWGQRYKLVTKDELTDEKFYDWDQHIADEGYLVLAGKVRKSEERSIIEEVIEKHIKRKVNPENLFSFHASTSPVTKNILESVLNCNVPEFSHVVWTFNMRRLAVLIAKSFAFNEPVLLVGETGCGKTTICQVLACLRKCKLLTVNCHMHTESADFLGGLRPVRHYKNDGKLFEWVDGPLIKAMETGCMFLADEISLADDSVLERLNSLLEPERQLVLAERGTDEQSDIIVITAENNFHFIGTMNPGGDFGKKELSPALRNRFTEIWCDATTSREDLLNVIEKSVNSSIKLGLQNDSNSGIGKSILEFTEWLKSSEATSRFPFSIRDLLGWVNFINLTVAKGLLNVSEAYVHGACMTFLDCFGTALTGHIDLHVLVKLRKNAIDFLMQQVDKIDDKDALINKLYDNTITISAERDAHKFGCEPFYVNVGSHAKESFSDFAFTAPTTGVNTVRLLRGMQLNKPILLEGNPGVGKTSLVTALGKISGHKVVRINLSDQTDITDLFGTDLPSDDGSFNFKEGAFLKALQDGHWILLDELNLAPQSVLEGLNACLDHRGEVYIPELGMTFKIKNETKLFACQNPLKQGGARKGLPLSFLNRFTQVYIDTLNETDLLFITESLYPTIPKDILQRIVLFTMRLEEEINTKQLWGHKGSPWEMNLRDIQRWCEAIRQDQKCNLTESNNINALPGKFVDILYINRMRTVEDKQKIKDYYDECFLPHYPRSDDSPQFIITDTELFIGDVTIKRNLQNECKHQYYKSDLMLLRSQMRVLRALTQNIKMNWMSIVVGSTATGKSSCVQILADLTGNELKVIPVTSAMDISDLLGGYEQVDYGRNIEILYDTIESIVNKTLQHLWTSDKDNLDTKLLKLMHEYKLKYATKNVLNVFGDDIKIFDDKINFLSNICEFLFKSYSDPNPVIDSIKEISSKLDILKAKINKLSSLNPGGRFEWVDSVLVKAMMKGSWVLLDNVNLTSAAVLDRLNGLLETNGVLSIPERGEVTEIIPHENFRVFFTMDPKYGEISRAMRNRGVELFILGPDESTNLDLVPQMDLFALISSTGLPSQYHSICKDSHELMCSLIQGLDRPTVSHLLHAAYLTWQQVRRGIFYKKSIINSFTDVYIKPRRENDFSSTVNTILADMKNYMLKMLESLLDKHSIQDFSCTYHTMSVSRITERSQEEIVKQISYPLIQSSLFHYSVSYVFDLLLAYNKTECRSASLLNFLIQNDSTSNQSNKTINKLNDIAYETILLMDNIESYKRYYPEAFNLTFEEVGLSNAKFIFMYHNLLNVISGSTIHKEKFSALDYSNAVETGAMIDDFVEFSILRDCRKYIEITDKAINELCSHVCIDDEVTSQLIQLLHWRTRFLKVCSSEIFAMKNRRPILRRELIPILTMHRIWMQKYLLDVIIKNLPPDHDLKKKNIEMIPDESENNYFLKISKKLRKIWGQPKLYKNDSQYKLCVLQQKIFSKIRLSVNCVSNLNTNIILHKKFNTNFGLALDVPEENVLHEFEKAANDISFENNTIHISELSKIVPFMDFILIRILNLVQSSFVDIVPKICNSLIGKNVDVQHKHVFNIDLDTIIPHILAATKEIRAFALEFSNIMELFLKLNNSDSEEIRNKASSFTVKFWNEFYKHLINSPARSPEPFFFDNNQLSLEESDTNDIKLPINMPIMLYLTQRLTLANSNSEGSQPLLAFEKVSLKNREEYLNQLTKCQNMLWKNVSMIKVSSELKMTSDAIFEIKKFEQLLCVLYLCLTDTDQTNILISDEIVKTIIDTIKDIDQKSSLIFTIVKAYEVYKELTNVIAKQIHIMTSYKYQIMTLKLSIYNSFILVKFMANMYPVDEVEKKKIKLSYNQEDLMTFKLILSSYYIQGVVSGTIPDTEKCLESSEVKTKYYEEGNPNRENLLKVHPHCSIILRLKEEILTKINKHSQDNTFRPSEPSYFNFSKDCNHFVHTVLSSKTTDDITGNLIKICDSLLGNIENTNKDTLILKRTGTIIKETNSWLFSVKAFYKKLEGEYSEAFPDLAKPLMSALSQMLYSTTSVNDLIKQMATSVIQGPEFTQDLKDLIVYPNAVPKEGHISKYLNRYIDPRFLAFVTSANTESDNELVADSRILDLLKMNLSELRMYCYSVEQIDGNSIDSIVKTLNLILEMWDIQQQKIRQKKEDDDALYVTKSKCEDIDEDFEAYEEISEMFPSYSETDFSEFKSPTLEQKKYAKKPTSLDEKGRLISIIKAEDVSLIYKWHSNLVLNLSSAEWLQKSPKIPVVDYTLPLLQRYPLFSQVVKNGWEALDANFDVATLPSLMVLMSNVKTRVEGLDTHNQKVDFYRSSWVSETKQCLPLLLEVRQSTNILLDQWPDFPTLKDILLIVNRILEFPLTSAVARFLTGLELLRDKIEEWNKNAHKGNNMIELSLQVGQQIINWRKLEMTHWKEILNNVYAKKQCEAHKYWFHLYNIIQSHLDGDSEVPVFVIREFMEKSNLVEFEVRLEMLFVFHCHLLHIKKNVKRDKLISVLWNIHNYYAQFKKQVTTYLKDKRAPIEKKLKDFVKICSWDRDLSYWSVKDTVEKAHKVLHKHTKEFEKLLEESVATCLVIDNTSESDNDHVGIWDRPKRTITPNALTGGAYMTEILNYLALSRNVKKYLDGTEDLSSIVPVSSLLLKVSSLFDKAKTLCKNTMNYTNYPTLIQGLDDFVTQVIETSNHLGSLEVDAAEPKNKQTSQAKSILQQKRKGLADLFRYLTKMGLNYRTGLVLLLSSEHNLYNFTIEPVNIDVAISYLKNRRCDPSLSLLWGGCENYFQKNIARHQFLSNALLTPHQDLGMQNIDRCKGFAAILMKMTVNQKKSIAQFSRQVCELRSIGLNLASALDLVGTSNIGTVLAKNDILSECYVQIYIVLEQFIELLKSFPEKNNSEDFEPAFDKVISDSRIVNCYKNSEDWNAINNKIKIILTKVKKYKIALLKLNNLLPNTLGKSLNVTNISQSHIDVSNDAMENLLIINEHIKILLQDFEFKFKAVFVNKYTPKHPLLISIYNVSSYIEDSIAKINNSNLNEILNKENDEKELLKEFTKDSEDLIATMLLVIQFVYKKHAPIEKNDEDVVNAIDDLIEGREGDGNDISKDNDNISKEILEDNHLKDLLQDKLTRDIKMLQIDALLDKTVNLNNKLVQALQSGKDVTIIKKVVMKPVAIFEQLILFIQYFLTQQVAVHRVSCKMLSILLKIFSDLSTKGFCKPSDIDMDGEGEEGPGKLSGGTGLGDGEGKTDVSDQIENQDQLDDAKRPGEERKEEERDCKEEEKGVNMTDDFDSHLQDVDKKDDDENEQEDEDDADKQMGETDNAAEKLDNQIWGSEDEDLNEDNSKEQEESGKGESTGEKELGAKEQEHEADDGSQGKEKQNKKDINEMPNDQEVDDDQVDTQHGIDPNYPEPEDFELPENANMDGKENDEEGETETENPFEITKEDMPKNLEDEQPSEEKEKNDEGLQVSSDDDYENENNDGKNQQDGMEEEHKNDKQGQESEGDENDDKNDEDSEMLVDEENLPDEQTEPESKDPQENLPKNQENINEDDKVEEKNNPNPESDPSNNDVSQEEQAENAEMNHGTDDNVQVNPEQLKDDESAPFEQSQEQVGDERQATGRADLDKSEKGHKGQKDKAKQAESNTRKEQRKQFENKPGITDEKRTLAEVTEKRRNKTHTLNVEQDDEAMEEGAEDNANNDAEADAYQHVKQANKDDIQAVDAATKEQADQQPTIQQEDEPAEEPQPDDDLPMEVDDDEIQVEKAEKELKPEKSDESSKKEDDKNNDGHLTEAGEDKIGDGVEVEGTPVTTHTVPRGADTTYFTRLDESNTVENELSREEYIELRGHLEPILVRGTDTAGVQWRELWASTGGAARSLCERLRLVLEPTARSRLAGDYRSGRRINMRRVIPYIASQFRKDRIWLRRSRPAKRDYHIAVALDDSSSMADNRSKQLAFESLALVSQALNLLESGNLSVLSFGEQPSLLHPFSEQFSEHSGAKIIQRLLFDQTKTKIAQLLDFCTIMFDEVPVSGDAVNAKLLVIVSDGRGIFSEGEARVLQAVRRARQHGIFLVYIIIDNPDNKDSIIDIRRPQFDPATSSLVGLSSYLDTFPFPYYVLVRDMNTLPGVLADALRQWFELAAR